MLSKSLKLLKVSSPLLVTTRSFASGDNFKFPKHKEFFNDKYYQHEESESPYAKTAPGPTGSNQDYVDPNNPFVQ
jgi:hypothetical protein